MSSAPRRPQQSIAPGRRTRGRPRSGKASAGIKTTPTTRAATANSKREAKRLPLPAADSAATPAGDTRERLLAAAHELLHERLGGPVSVNDICARAGANVAMVKYCFGGKDAMLVALIQRVVGGFVGELEELDRRHLNASAKLRLHIAEIVRNYVRYPYLNRLLSYQLLGAGKDGAMTLARDFAVPARDWYRRLLAEGHASGEFRVVDPTLFFFTVIGIAEFFFTAQPLLRGFGIREVDTALLERYISHVTGIVLHGVQAGPSGSRGTRALRRKPVGRSP
jgi:AcrR family transcriptional regulator